MAERFGTFLSGAMEGLVRFTIVPATAGIAFLVSSGVMLAVSAVLWMGIATAIVADERALQDAWRSIGTLPLPVLGLAWLLLLPEMAGLWVWTTSWPLALRLIVIAGLGAWTMLVFVPRRGSRTGTTAEPTAAER